MDGFRSDETGVTSVVGTVLMVGIVVILGAVVLTAVGLIVSGRVDLIDRIADRIFGLTVSVRSLIEPMVTIHYDPLG